MSSWTKGVLLIAGIPTALLAVTVSLVDADDRMSLWVIGVIMIVLLVIPLIGMAFALRHWKVVGVTLIVCCGVAWGGFSYLTRPHRVEELARVRLGMTPVEVTLALGEANSKTDVTFSEDLEAWWNTWTYDDLLDSKTTIFFNGEEASDLTVYMIDTDRADLSFFGFNWNYQSLGVGSSESDVLERLGAPDTESISEAGTHKLIFYREWQTGFIFEQSNVVNILVSEQGAAFINEYDDNPETP